MNALNIPKGSIVLTGFALILFVASVAGVDRKYLKPKVDITTLSAVYKRLADDSLKVGSALDGRLATALDSKFVIAERVPYVPDKAPEPALDPSDQNAPGLQIIRVSGIMKTTGESYQSIVNKSLMREGSMIYGCKVVKITDKSVSFEVNGQVRTIGINEEIKVTSQSSQLLNLDSIEVRDGVWVAQINGNFYRSGDWIDDRTQIKAVTPSTVMIARAGSMIVLRYEQK